ncbi:MAG: DUF502 domain-containing protein [Gammaproteobacteria bacterium]|nr:DUF502 domain-containing protein [Gammaproteobacteria bacterium]
MATKSAAVRIQRYVITGVITLIPIWITLLVFEFIYNQLSKFGKPGAMGIAASVQELNPTLAEWVVHPWVQSTLAVLVTLAMCYLLGWTATKVLGRRLLSLFDAFMVRIPMVQSIYGATKKLVASLQQKPEGMQRVVLIHFPAPHLRTIGFVTKILRDKTTNRELAAVYVPTAPNPTSGYMEIVPVEDLIPVDWTMDEAMTFIITGGAVAPDTIQYTPPTAAEQSPPV